MSQHMFYTKHFAEVDTSEEKLDQYDKVRHVEKGYRLQTYIWPNLSTKTHQVKVI